jgi:hypothetical protein
MIHINAQSIRYKLNELEVESEDADLIAISESWLEPNIKSEDIAIPSFHPPIRKDRPTDAHGGVAIFCRENHIIKHRPDLDTLNLEIVWAELNLKGRQVLVAAAYRPPNSNTEYWDLLEENLEQAKSSGIPNIFLLGDLNCDMSIPNNKLERLLSNLHFTQVITSPTHITTTSETIIDIIATTSLDLVHSSMVRSPSLSNHCDTGILINLKNAKRQTHPRQVYNYKKANWEKLNNDLKTHNWEPILQHADINQQAAEWTATFLRYVRANIPYKLIQADPDDHPWITAGVRKLRKEKEKAHRKAKKRNRPPDWEKFKTLRNGLQHQIKTAKTEHFQKLADKIEGCTNKDEKLWWKLTKRFYQSHSNRKAQTPPLLIDGKPIEGNKQKAEEFANFFTEMTTLDTANAPALPEVPPTEHTLSAIRIPHQTVLQILQNLNPSKASGPDTVSPRMLKETSKSIAPSLTRIFNYSLATSKFPDDWKVANITPLHKKNDKQKIQNYRPISLLSCTGKCLERCVNEELLKFLLETNNISTLQSAFTPKNSTTNQLLDLYHQIVAEMDKGKDIRFIVLDFSKAFDRVWHKGIIYKLAKAGITDPFLSWFRDYLHNRKHRVVVEGDKSILHDVTAGVPQGSVLGPILFILYINDIINQTNINVRLYADDATIFISYEDSENAARKIEENLQSVHEWASFWFMTFNPQKTESLTFTRKRNPVIPTIYLNGTEITEVEEHKHLGVTLQKDAKWIKHIKEITSRSKRRLDVLRSYSRLLDRRSLEKLYLTFIRPILEYSDVVWDNCRDLDKLNLEAIQLDAARIVTGAKRRTQHKLLYEDVQWETLDQRRQKHKLITMYKINHDLAPETLTNLLTLPTAERHNYNVRSREDLTLQQTSTTSFDKSFFPTTIKLWNSLSPATRHLSSVEAFKEALKGPVKLNQNHYYTGKREVQILQARMRLMSSDLNSDRERINLVADAGCACGYRRESAEHYLLSCPNYFVNRAQLLNDLLPLNLNPIEFTSNVLLRGNPLFTENQNNFICTAVHKYILSTNRFNQ